MSYDAVRADQITKSHERRIEDFVREYNPDKKTVVLVPGGMGSQLDRSSRPYAGASSLPFPHYDPVWIDWGILFNRDAVTLRIGEDGHDADDHVIIPNGPLRFFLVGDMGPYNLTERFFKEQGYNFVAFGYDWRRPVGESASFLEMFLRKMGSRAKALRGKDPRPEATLLCHSMGGLVAKALLNRIASSASAAAKVGQWLERIVTVGTPFYGTSGHIQRYYLGQDPLNRLYGTKTVAKMSATMPGPYILMPADAATIERDGQALGLSQYPMRDADTDEPADPYAASSTERYPSWVRPGSLDLARRTYASITKPLPAAAIARLFHVRSGLRRMATEWKWDDIDGSAFNPDRDDSPVRGIATPDGDGNLGDGTVPYWSARLAQTPDDHIYDLRRADDHGLLLEHGEVLKVVLRTIETGSLPQVAPAPAPVPPVKRASKAAVEQFVDDVAAGRADQTDPRATNPQIWRWFIEEIAP